MTGTRTYIAWLFLFFSLLAWVAVVYAAFSIRGEAASSASTAESADQQLDRLAYTQRLSSLVATTADERALLDSFAQLDVVSIVKTMEAAGKSMHVNVQVNDAQPEIGAQALPGGGNLQPVGFVVEARGTFSSLMRVTALFEHLPLVSSVEQVELEYLGTSGAGVLPWHLTLRVRVYTTAPVSS